MYVYRWYTLGCCTGASLFGFGSSFLLPRYAPASWGTGSRAAFALLLAGSILCVAMGWVTGKAVSEIRAMDHAPMRSQHEKT